MERLLRVAFLAAAIVAVMLLSACAGSRGGPVPYNVEGFVAPDAPTALPLAEDYRIAPLDTLKVDVFQVKDLSGEFEVDLTGHISMPLIGSVKAIDLTTAELDRKLTDALGAKYLQNPDVSVGVKSSTRRSITVDGAVNSPGMFPVTGPMTLVQAVAMARGTSEYANPRRVAVFRQISGQRTAAAFDLTTIRQGKDEDPKIYSGDIIVVDGSGVKQMYRELLTSLPLLSIFRPF
jgi:polysaccharide biosynthesis/export protein